MKRGFTLVEVLVVVAIVAIVAAVMFPVLRRSKQSALETQSISNMRQLYVAIQLYRGESDNVLYGKLEEMGLPPAPSAKYLGNSVAALHPPMRRAGTLYYYYPIESRLDRRTPTWADYIAIHEATTVLLADAWFDLGKPQPPYTNALMDPVVEKRLIGITVDGSIRRKRAPGRLDLVWWDR